MLIFCNITIFTILFTFIYYYISKVFTLSLQYRVLYYIPTGEAIGVIYRMNDKNDFYFYQQDLPPRIEGMTLGATERFLQSIKTLTSKQLLSFFDFHNYFSDNFYVSPIVPMAFWRNRQYSVKRDILKAYKHHKIKKEKKAQNEIDKRPSDRRLFGRCKALYRRCISHLRIW